MPDGAKRQIRWDESDRWSGSDNPRSASPKSALAWLPEGTRFMFATKTQPIQIGATYTDAQPQHGLAESILTGEAIRFLGKLARAFEPRRRQLLEARRVRQREIDAGTMPDLLPSTAPIRN